MYCSNYLKKKESVEIISKKYAQLLNEIYFKTLQYNVTLKNNLHNSQYKFLKSNNGPAIIDFSTIS